MTRLILALLISFVLHDTFAQQIITLNYEALYDRPRPIAPGEYVIYEWDDSDQSGNISPFLDDTPNQGDDYDKTITMNDTSNDPWVFLSMSRYLFDSDEGIEYLSNDPYDAIVSIPGIGDVPGYPKAILPASNGSKLVIENNGQYTYYDLPGTIPTGSSQSNQPVVSRIDTVYQVTRDTVYIENVTSRIDTVRELITERIYTSDTVYLSETINVQGGADTVYISRTTTQRDTVYNYTENTIYNVRVDSTYLLGADYLADLNTVTDLDSEFESQIELRLPYPSPTSDYVHLTYSSNNKEKMTLAIYDNQGNRIDKFTVRGENPMRIDVRNYASGVYVCIAFGPKGKTTTRKFVVN